MVCANTHERPKRIPEDLLAAFEPYMTPPPLRPDVAKP